MESTPFVLAVKHAGVQCIHSTYTDMCLGSGPFSYGDTTFLKKPQYEDTFDYKKRSLLGNNKLA